jgi:hypothetical protein
VLGATVVLANGTVVEASATSHPDLFWAIRGGGPFYAVVAKWIFRLSKAPAKVRRGSGRMRAAGAAAALGGVRQVSVLALHGCADAPTTTACPRVPSCCNRQASIVKYKFRGGCQEAKWAEVLTAWNKWCALARVEGGGTASVCSFLTQAACDTACTNPGAAAAAAAAAAAVVQAPLGAASKPRPGGY